MSSEQATRISGVTKVVENVSKLLLACIEEQDCHSNTSTNSSGSGSHQSEIERLDRLTGDTISAAESLQLAVRREAAILRRRRNSLLPLHQLPLEILALILLESLDFEEGFSKKALQSLAQVTHRWWEIIKSEPRFWTRIEAFEDIALHIRKAGALPLEITIARARQNHQDAASLLRAHSDRWFKIRLMSDPAPGFMALERSAFLKLEFLEIPHHHDDIIHLELGHLERLRHARLAFIPCIGHREPRNPTPRLESLSLSLLQQRRYPSCCLVSFLQSCPSLQKLEIHHLTAGLSDDGPHDISPSLISLPALHSLSIRDVKKSGNTTDIPILGLIRCPNLATFKVQYFSSSWLWIPFHIGAAAIFRVLLSSPIEAEASPLRSVLRNIGESAYFRILLQVWTIQILAQNRDVLDASKLPLEFVLPVRDSVMEDFARNVIPHLTSFDTPIEVCVDCDVPNGVDYWGGILDGPGSRNLTVLECVGTTLTVQNLLDSLSHPTLSPPVGGPRAPSLEVVVLDEEDTGPRVGWMPDVAPQIAAMLRKRRELFDSVGMDWPSRFQVKWANSHIFDEHGGIWRDVVPSVD